MLDLPTELVRQICTDTDFDRRDLMALRSTCALTCGFSTHPFDDMCFTTVSILLTRRSLQALIDNSKHERIGPQIQIVSLTPLRSFPEALSGPLPVNCFTLPGGDPAKDKIVHRYLDRYHEEVELEQIQDAVKLLTEAFISLKSYVGYPMCVAISDVEKTPIGAQDCSSGSLVKTGEEKDVFRMYWSEAMSVLINAVAESGCPVIRLSLINEANAELMGEGELWADDLDEKINHLSADLAAFDMHSCVHDPDVVTESVQQLLSQAKNLQSFAFHPSGPHLYSDLIEISNSIASSSLQAIAMSYLYCPVSDLITFLRQHQSTLLVFYLETSCLVGPWRSLVQWIGSNLISLRTFAIRNVYDDCQLEAIPSCTFDVGETEDMPTALTEEREDKANDDTLLTD